MYRAGLTPSTLPLSGRNQLRPYNGNGIDRLESDIEQFVACKDIALHDRRGTSPRPTRNYTTGAVPFGKLPSAGSGRVRQGAHGRACGRPAPYNK